MTDWFLEDSGLMLVIELVSMGDLLGFVEPSFI